MASGGKKKMKGKSMNLSEFLGTTDNIVSTKKVDWAAEMDDLGDDDGGAAPYGQPLFDRSVLPKAPKASRGPDVDMSKIPTQPPFTAFIGNLPYESCESKIEQFFDKLKFNNVRLPNEGGRLRGFGYVEFDDRESLIEALTMNEAMFMNRKIRIDLAGQNQSNQGEGREGRRDHQEPDKLMSDWRRAPANDDQEDSRNDSRYGDRDGYGSRDSGRYGDRDGGRDGYGSRDGGRFGDRDGGRYGDRDGYGSRDGGRYGDRDGGGRYGDRYGDRDGGRYGDRDGGRYGSRDGGRYGDRDSGRYGDRDGGRYGDRDGGGRYGDRYGDRDGSRYGNRGDRDGGRYGSRDGGRYGSRGGSYDNRDGPRDSSQEAPKERKKLQLAPRSKPVEQDNSTPAKTSSIFGSAKPVDTAAKERAIEERLKSENLTKTVEPAAPKEKKASIFGDAKPVDTAAKERAIEERLRKQHESDKILHDDDRHYDSYPEDDRPLAKTDNDTEPSGRTRRNSEENRRERHLSNSSSGKGSRQGHNSGGRSRKDSELSNHSQDLGDDGHHTTSPKHEDTTPVKIIPAPPPKENAWAKRKPEIMSPPSQQPQAPASRGSENNTSKVKSPGSRDIRQDKPRYDRDGHDHRDNRRDERRDRHEGPVGKSDTGRNKENTKPKKEKVLPKSIEEMPKYNKTENKDWSDKNKFALISSSKSDEDDDDEDDDDNDDNNEVKENEISEPAQCEGNTEGAGVTNEA